MGRLAVVGWAVVAVVLVALAIPWFLWGNDTVVYGLPIWLWWHVGWMLLASLVFWLFANRAWGIGVEPGSATPESARDVSPGAGGDSSRSHGGDRP